MLNKLFFISLFMLSNSKPIIDTCNEVTFNTNNNSSCLTCQFGVGLIRFENKFLNYSINQTQNSIQNICNNTNITSIPQLISECYYLSNNTIRILNLTKYNNSIFNICNKIKLC
jgi:hypothetical protein